MKSRVLRGIEIGIICLAFTLVILKLVLGVGVAVVLSGSMEPTIKVDDLIVYMAKDSYKPGEVVVYQDEGSMTVHRIVKKSKTNIITQGDNNNAQDEPINENQIKGKYVFSIPNWGKIFGSKESLFSLKGAMAKYASSDMGQDQARVAKLRTQVINITSSGATYSLSPTIASPSGSYSFKIKKSGDTAARLKVDLISPADISSAVGISLCNMTDARSISPTRVSKSMAGGTVYSFEDAADFAPGEESKSFAIEFALNEGEEIEEYQNLSLSVRVRVSQID